MKDTCHSPGQEFYYRGWATLYHSGPTGPVCNAAGPRPPELSWSHSVSVSPVLLYLSVGFYAERFLVTDSVPVAENVAWFLS